MSSANTSAALQEVERDAAASAQPRGEFWPFEASHRATLTIGKVVEQLQQEFPALSLSKIRFMEEQGIYEPVRAANGYRRFSPAHVERIRFALTAQRDSFLPWDRIRADLQALDRGEQLAPPAPKARIVSVAGQVKNPPRDARITTRDLLDYTGASKEQIDALVKAQILAADASGRFPGAAVEVVRTCLVLQRVGIQPRNLRSIRSLALGTVDLIDRVVEPTRARGGAVDRERAAAQATDLSRELTKLISNLIQIGVNNLD